MSEDLTTPAAQPKKKAATEPTPAAQPPAVKVRVKVLLGGLKIARGTAAAGKVLTVSPEVAEFHENRGEVKILGTV